MLTLVISGLCEVMGDLEFLHYSFPYFTNFLQYTNITFII